MAEANMVISTWRKKDKKIIEISNRAHCYRHIATNANRNTLLPDYQSLKLKFISITQTEMQSAINFSLNQCKNIIVESIFKEITKVSISFKRSSRVIVETWNPPDGNKLHLHDTIRIIRGACGHSPACQLKWHNQMTRQ